MHSAPPDSPEMHLHIADISLYAYCIDRHLLVMELRARPGRT